jgi:hypothetical protein
MKRSPLHRKTLLKRTGRLRAVSKKLAPKLRQYSLQRVQFLQRNPRCQYRVLTGQCCNGATEVHHMQGRGPNLLREETWMACCNRHHASIHANPRAARENGYLK